MKQKHTLLKNILLVLYAAGTGVSFDLVGRLRLSEVAALFNIPFINISMLLRCYPGYKLVMQCLLVFLLSQVVSDVINESDAIDYLRGWSTIIFAMISTTVMLSNLHENERGIVVYLATLLVINIIFQEVAIDMMHQEEDTNYFKARLLGFINPAVLLFALYLSTNGKQRAIVLLMGSFSIVCFVMDARSNGLVFFIAAIVLFIKSSHIRISSGTIIFLASVIIPASYFLYTVYVDQVLYHGFGGKNSQINLSMAANPYNPFELLYYGRSDFFALIEAIKDSPFFGHGSWGKDPTFKYTDIRTFSQYLGGENEGIVVAHSVILGSWAWSGFIGFCAVVFMFKRLFGMIVQIYRHTESVYLPIIIVMGCDMLWAFFFSPLGLLRTTFPFFAAVVITQYYQLRKIEPKHTTTDCKPVHLSYGLKNLT